MAWFDGVRERTVLYAQRRYVRVPGTTRTNDTDPHDDEWGNDVQDTDRTTTPPHGLRHERPRGDPRLLRGRARFPAAGDVVGGRRAVRCGARVLPYVLRPCRRQRAGLLPVCERGRSSRVRAGTDALSV